MGTDSRTKTGCLTCRQRRKKCDEKKPVCSGCARNYLGCTWQDVFAAKDVKTRPIPVNGSRKKNHLALPTKESGCLSPIRAVVTPVETLSSLSASHDSTVSSNRNSADHNEHALCNRRFILWHPSTTSFISSERAVCLTPVSSLLYQHFVKDTVTFLVAKPVSHNPFATCILPLTHSDDLLMHAVLALSGVHLSFQTGQALDIQYATSQHYSILLLGLRTAFSDPLLYEDSQRIWRLLLILMVLCHVEALSGEPHGGIFPHLRASRQLVLRLLHKQETSYQHESKFIKGFVLETYSYLTLVNSITPHGRYEARTIPLDDFICCLEFLREYETYGIFIGCGQGLFELIPRISILAAKRLALEIETDAISSDIQIEGDDLLGAILEWELPPVESIMSPWEYEHGLAAEIYRQALLIYLKTTMCGSVVRDPKLIIELQQHVEYIVTQAPLVGWSPYASVLLWPIMMAACCTVTEAQRETLTTYLRRSRIDVAQIPQALQILELLWQDTDKRSFGPYGLCRIMEQHSINFSMA